MNSSNKIPVELDLMDDDERPSGIYYMRRSITKLCERPFRLDYMEIVIPYQQGPSIDANERSTGLNDVHYNPIDVCGSTVVLVIFKLYNRIDYVWYIFISRIDVEVDELFFSKVDLKMRLSIMSINNNFKYKVKKSNKSLFTIKCIEINCKWCLYEGKLQGCDMFKIAKYISSHTCSIRILNHDYGQAITRLVGQLIKRKFIGIEHVNKPKYIVEDMRRDCSINISYNKAWRAEVNNL